MNSLIKNKSILLIIIKIITVKVTKEVLMTENLILILNNIENSRIREFRIVNNRQANLEETRLISK
jgi:hypothetical protein